MHLKGWGLAHTYRCSILTPPTPPTPPLHTIPELNGSSLMKLAIPPPTCATVLTFEKSRRISSQRRRRSPDFILMLKHPCPMRHNAITLTLIKRTLYMEMETGFSKGHGGNCADRHHFTLQVHACSLSFCVSASLARFCHCLWQQGRKKKKSGSNVP